MKKLILVLIVLYQINLFSQIKIMMFEEGGVYKVPCKINSLPLKFIFDTGASDVSISLSEAVFMLKNGYLNKKDIGEAVYYSIANGDVAKGTKLNIKEIEFGGLKLYNVEASIVHETNAPLLLGQSVISKLGKIQLDGNELIILTKGSSSYNYRSMDKENDRDYYTSIINISDKYENIYPYNKTFYGDQIVYSYSSILNKPDMINGKRVSYAVDNKITILRKINEAYYKVESGNRKGYMWAGWFKE